MDLDLWDCFGRKKTPSYNRRNTVVDINGYISIGGNSDQEEFVLNGIFLKGKIYSTVFHSERPKLNGVLAFLSVIGLKEQILSFKRSPILEGICLYRKENREP